MEHCAMATLGTCPCDNAPTDLREPSRSPRDKHPEATWYSEPSQTGNQVETSGLIGTDYLNQQLARQEIVLRTAMKDTITEQLAPLLEQVQVLIDSTSKATTCPQECNGEAPEYSLTSSHSEGSSVADAQITFRRKGFDSPAPFSHQRETLHLSRSSIASLFSLPSWLAASEDSMITRVNKFLRDLSQPMSQRISNSIKGNVGFCQKPTADCLLRFVESSLFVGFTGVLIILNACFIGYQTEQSFKQLSGTHVGDATILIHLSRAFAFLFLLELVLRLLARRGQFFAAGDWKWNLFDAFLVVTSCIDEVMTTQVNLSATRMLRVFRMARLLRIIRIVEAFRELREMLCSVIASVKSIFWAIILLCLAAYLFAILFMQSALHTVEQDGAQPEEFQAYWGSVLGSMYTLLAAISGGQSWVEFVAPFDPYSPWYRAGFSFFIVFVMFGMLNILTGVFVARAAEICVLDKDLIIQAENISTRSVVQNLRDLFQGLDIRDDGKVDIEQLNSCISGTDVRAYLAALNMHTRTFKQVIAMLDPLKTGQVSINEFIAGCLEFKGNASAVDVANLLHQHKRHDAKLKMVSKQVQILLDLNTPHGTTKCMLPWLRVRSKRRLGKNTLDGVIPGNLDSAGQNRWISL